ncbi:hypothetical protein GCM10023322_80050 [Rugosimonospora acidiphila]|uniref:Polyketide cyclase / dehydrase and lipid transport n=1 Tax=Rugosimonospora acidiphila TaxID=556531 RepID=A0ABP9STN8_9ACTN
MRTSTQDQVTGATTEVRMEVDLPIEEVWARVTEVGRVGRFSPECVHAAWLDGTDGAPVAGARFEGRNEFPDGFVATVECVVTEAREPSVFEWVVLDGDREVARPGSAWRYELRPGSRPGTTELVHRFTHGAGMTGLRRLVVERPGEAEAVVRERLATLHANMTTTLSGMMDRAPAGSTTPVGDAK